MNTLLKWTVMLTLCSGTAYGQVPASNDTSDDNFNTGVGTHALNGPVADNPGISNTAIGSNTLFDNTNGSFNTAVGSSALFANSTGNYNTASGFEALLFSTTGGENTASGTYALFSNTTGNNNTATGLSALYSNTTGIYGNTAVSGLAVVIGSNGELGAVSSSERFKTGIAPMGSNTEKLQQLRPVTFHYKADAEGTLRYGLIAEDVAKVYPELVVPRPEWPDRRHTI